MASFAQQQQAYSDPFAGVAVPSQPTKESAAYQTPASPIASQNREQEARSAVSSPVPGSPVEARGSVASPKSSLSASNPFDLNLQSLYAASPRSSIMASPQSSAASSATSPVVSPVTTATYFSSSATAKGASAAAQSQLAFPSLQAQAQQSQSEPTQPDPFAHLDEGNGGGQSPPSLAAPSQFATAAPPAAAAAVQTSATFESLGHSPSLPSEPSMNLHQANPVGGDPWASPLTPAAQAPPPQQQPNAQQQALVPSAQPNNDPYGVGQVTAAMAAANPFENGGQVAAATTASHHQGALIPSAVQSSYHYAQQRQQPAAVPAAAPASPHAHGQPYAQPQAQAQPQPQPHSLSQPHSSAAAATAAAAAVTAAAPERPIEDVEDSFWAKMGVSTTPAAAPQTAIVAAAAPVSAKAEPRSVGAVAEAQEAGSVGAVVEAPPAATSRGSAAIELDSMGLPMGGSTYSARIKTNSLGVIFFSPPELQSNLLYRLDASAQKALGQRPVVGHVFEGSAAQSSGVLRGHVLLSVNGLKVDSAHEAKTAVREADRPMNLEFWIPPAETCPMTNEEGTHLVKYDTIDKVAPPGLWEWKYKYVVVGGIVAKPWMVMMYRSKTEYDTAVRATMAELPPNVKVKAFDLRQARLWNDHVSPLRLLSPYAGKKNFRYISILPHRGYPIKIACPEGPDGLNPVMEGVRRALRGDYEGSIYSNSVGGFGRSSSSRSAFADNSAEDDELGQHQGATRSAKSSWLSKSMGRLGG